MNLFSKFYLSILGLLLTTITFAQVNSGDGAYPFPQNATSAGSFGNYAYTVGNGVIPASANAAEARQAYEYWKTNFTTGSCDGTRRVIFDYFGDTGKGDLLRRATVSEGIGYGMVLAAYFDDKDLFDGLWAYYKKFMNDRGVMHFYTWETNGQPGDEPRSSEVNPNNGDCYVAFANGATDAELDCALGLIVANYQWNDDSYADDASVLIANIRIHEFLSDGTQKSGDAFQDNDDIINVSYFAPAYYRLFKEFDQGQDAFWDSAISKCYSILNSNAGTSGFVSDWCGRNGDFSTSPSANQYDANGRNFDFDAVRTPFRIAMDVLWNDDTNAKTYCENFTTTLNATHGGNPYQVKDKYYSEVSGGGATAGQPVPGAGPETNTFLGCFGVGAMGAYENTSLDAFRDALHLANVDRTPNYGEYFNASFRAWSLLIQSGNFWLPPPDQCELPDLGPDRSLCETSVVLDAGVGGTGYTYKWRKGGETITSALSQTYTATTPGVYQVIATSPEGCARRDEVEVFEGDIEAGFTAVPGPASIILTNTSTGGISNYLWTVAGPLGGEETSTEEVFAPTATLEGVYTVKLEINNSGFGTPACSDTDEFETTVVIGGNGIALDVFTDPFNRGFIMFGFGIDGEPNPFDLPVFDQVNCGPGFDVDIPDGRCGFADIVCVAGDGAVDYASFAFDISVGNPALGPVDLSTGGAYLSIKLSATAPVTVGVGLEAGEWNATPALNTQSVSIQNIDLTTDPQVFTLDFNTDVALAVDDIRKILVRPYVDDVTYTGTISVDYVVLGSAVLPKPEFDIFRLPSGCPDYDVYGPEVRPYDPEYAACTIDAAEGSGCYGEIPAWKQVETLCSGTAILDASSACTATEIRWYDGDNTYLGSGDTWEIDASGWYYVELIGAGGSTRDSVLVSGAAVEAAFTASPDQGGLAVNTFNTSIESGSGAVSYLWTFGDVAETTSTDEQVYIDFKDLDGLGTYEVCLIATESTCGVSDTFCEMITAECGEIIDPVINSSLNMFANDTVSVCEGDDVEIYIENYPDIENQSFTGWFGDAALALPENWVFTTPSDSSLRADIDTLRFTPTGSTDVSLSISHFGPICASENKDVSIRIELTPAPVTSLDEQQQFGNLEYGFTAGFIGKGAGVLYKWDIDPDVAGYEATPDTNYLPWTYASVADIKPVTLLVENSCGEALLDTTFTPILPICNGLTRTAVAATIVGEADLYCEQGEWTHYIDPTDGVSIFFSIKKGANAAVDFTPEVFYDADCIENEDATVSATYTMGRSWNIIASDDLVEPVSIRFYFDKNELDEINTKAGTFATANSVQEFGPKWFKTVGVDWNPADVATFVSALGLEATAVTDGDVIELTETSIGYLEDPLAFVQIDGITSFSGGTAFSSAGGQTLLAPTTEEQLAFENAKQSIHVVENPSFTEFEVQTNGSLLLNSYSISNISGAIVESGGIGIGKFYVGGSLSSGVYLLTIYSNDGEIVKIEKLVKL